jgi:hypothetical protein
MEQFFAPTRRLQDHYDFVFDEDHGYTEVQFAVSTEAFLNRSWDWSEFQAFTMGGEGEMGRILWITEDTFLYVEDDDNDQEEFIMNHLGYHKVEYATFTLPSGETHVLILAKLVDSASLLTGASSVFWHAVTTSKCVKLNLEDMNNLSERLSGPALLHFQTAILGLELLEFEGYTFEGDDYRTLANLERTGLEVTFQGCSFYAHGVKDTFIEWLRHSQVVTKLEHCTMEDSILSALSGNSSVKTFSIDATQGKYLTRSLARALTGNQGIEALHVVLSPRDGTWSLLLRSLWAHPRIQSVTLWFVSSLSALSKTIMMYEVRRLAHCNTVVHTINLPDHAKDEEFFQNSIVPRLEMNRNCFQDQRQALTRADPAIRSRLLGRALHVVRHNPDLLFRFLSENVPAFMRSDDDGPIIPTG